MLKLKLKVVVKITIGDKIKQIRLFVKMTQKQLGILIGLDEKNADVRIAQYETNYRVPKEDIITKVASVLDVNPLAISSPNNNSLEEIMYNLFKIEEDFKFKISIIKSVNGSGEEVEQIALVSDSEILKNVAEEWVKRREELEKGEITEDEYLAWKLNWPDTCDNNGTIKPIKEWRRSEK